MITKIKYKYKTFIISFNLSLPILDINYKRNIKLLGLRSYFFI